MGFPAACFQIGLKLMGSSFFCLQQMDDSLRRPKRVEHRTLCMLMSTVSFALVWPLRHQLEGRITRRHASVDELRTLTLVVSSDDGDLEARAL